ncbi:MAG: hypothetical protein LBS36_07020 [Oscillospiraceae bacterium]|jgi:16S rRNA A1518/A1519 N6-dimethyltransferase RsmA/KsgA/DIM1 with predicted DNA glycosylase/AP lyase activity|nr:hypothetical protein [Oscillospiraceae bacterium]
MEELTMQLITGEMIVENLFEMFLISKRSLNVSPYTILNNAPYNISHQIINLHLFV